MCTPALAAENVRPPPHAVSGAAGAASSVEKPCTLLSHDLRHPGHTWSMSVYGRAGGLPLSLAEVEAFGISSLVTHSVPPPSAPIPEVCARAPHPAATPAAT
ncbi:hypothetical protein EON66_01900 [archaeon]|nr:MAG: hypothetical protein EON66_01900 [archaeon]